MFDVIFEKRVTVRSYEVDFRLHCRPHTLLDYLQDASVEHAEALGWGIDTLFTRGLTWVLSRYHVAMDRLPRMGERLTVRTWPSAHDERRAWREFEIVDQQERSVARATGTYVMVDLATKRPVALAEKLGEMIEDSRAVMPRDFPRLEAVDEPDRELPFRVRMSDLDPNDHVNHAEYVGWALETPPTELLRSHRPSEVVVVYRREARYGDRVLARVRDRGAGVFDHQLLRESDGAELTRLRTRWVRVD